MEKSLSPGAGRRRDGSPQFSLSKREGKQIDEKGAPPRRRRRDGNRERSAEKKKLLPPSHPRSLALSMPADLFFQPIFFSAKFFLQKRDLINAQCSASHWPLLISNIFQGSSTLTLKVECTHTFVVFHWQSHKSLAKLGPWAWGNRKNERIF